MWEFKALRGSVRSVSDGTPVNSMCGENRLLATPCGIVGDVVVREGCEDYSRGSFFCIAEY